MRNAMPQPDQPESFSQGGRARVARLARYLGADTARRLADGQPPERELLLATAQLAAARYAISTYLPRRLLSRQLSSVGVGPWIEWVDGSLLFADVSGSTALAERLSSLGREGTELVTDTLNSYFGTMIRVIQATGGDLLSFGGDALLVLFEGPNHAQLATATALALLRDLAGFEREVPGVGRFPLTMHIGVETGQVALVSAGQPHALRYSAMGATVNTVARAEGFGGRGELVLGPRAWALVAERAQGEPVPSAEGFVRVHAMGGDPLPPSRPPEVAPPPILSPTALDSLARQLDRLSPYLPPELLSRVLADPNRPRVEADLRPVTVLFAQVQGLGALVETLSPDRAAAAVDAFLRPMQAAVEQFGGFVNKLDLADEGDKLMAVFGAPVALEDHAERAARAALAMMAAIEPCVAQLAEWPEPQAAGVELQLRIGINTGNVFAGNVGTAERKEYTVMGDAVNVAARVMAVSAWGEVRCAAITAALVKQTLLCDDPRMVRVRGKSEPLQLLRLVGEADRSARTTDAATPLVGRERELSWLEQQLAAAAAGHGRAIRIAGEAGVGKSRLGAALLEKATAAGAVTLSVRCLAFNSAAPYTPWSDLVSDLCGVSAADDQQARARKLGAALKAAGVEVADWLPLVADLVRLDVEDSAVTRALDPQQRQARRFEIVLALLRSLTHDEGRMTKDEVQTIDHQDSDPAGQPLASGPGTPSSFALRPSSLVLLFDNLQWADQVSLDLWQYVSARIADDPLLLLGLHRSALTWGSGQQGDGAALLELGPLDVEAGGALLDELAAPDSIDPELRERLVVRAAGNPLFLEELQRAVASDPETIDALPDSLSGLLLARIDRLDERSRALLRVAAVVGQRFPVGVMQSVYERDYETLVQSLGELDAQEFTAVERERPERVHLFRHALLQEVAYQSLLYARRRELHRRIGAYLEERYADDLEAVRAQYAADSERPLVQIGRNGSLLSRDARANGVPIFLLAHHLRLSDDPARAVPYLLLAGHIARDDYANDQAVQHYRWALEVLAPSDPRAWEAHEALGDVLCTLGRYEEALGEYQAILEARSEKREGTSAQAAGTDQIHTHGSTQSAREPEAHSHSLIPNSELPSAVAAEVLRSMGDALEKQGRYAEALERLREAEALCRANLGAVPPLLLAAIYADMGQVLRRLSDFDGALDICRTGLAMVRADRRSAEDERIEAELQMLMGTLYAMRGEYDPARFHFENALAAQEAIDDLYGCARSQNNLGYLAQLQSDYVRAVRHYAEAETLARKVQTKYMLSSVLLNAAYGYYRLDRYAEAEGACRDALVLCEEMGDQLGVAQADDTLGLIAYSRGDYAAARAAYQYALTIYRAQNAAYQEGNTLAMLAAAHTASADAGRGRLLADEALQLAQRIQVPQLEAEALSALAEATLAFADGALTAADKAQLLAAAAAHAEQAAEIAGRLGSKLDQGVALRLRGEVAAALDTPFAQHFEAALLLAEQASSAFEQARAAARYGVALEARNLPGAAAYLMRARDTFRQIGADGELRRLPTAIERSQ
jgi:class 3 adenylate cyclase/predicted ATPase